jgi:hypothetical protein
MLSKPAAVLGLLGLLLCLVSCGGGDDENHLGDNQAIDHRFNYAQPMAANQQQAGVLQASLSSVASLQGSPNAAAALGLAGTSSITDALLGPSAIGVGPVRLGGAGKPAYRVLIGTDTSCFTATATQITYNHCTLTSGGVTETINGSFSVSSDGRSMQWDLTVTLAGTSSGASVNAAVHESGDLTVTSTTIKGNSKIEAAGSATSGGTTVDVALSEAVIIDVSYTVNPACITGGSIEARRVWSRRPQNLSASQLPDAAAKVTWTGCNQATIALGS